MIQATRTQPQTTVPPSPGESSQGAGEQETENTRRIAGRLWLVRSGKPRKCYYCESGIREVITCFNTTHAICQECSQRPDTRTCSMHCPTEMSEEVRAALSKSLVDNANECKFRCTEHGCVWEGQYSDLAHHASSCTHHIYHCKFQEYGCTEKDTRVALDEHVINCKFRKKICDRCCQSYSIADAEDHAQNSCPKRLKTHAVTLPQASWDLFDTIEQLTTLAPDSQQTVLQTTVQKFSEAERMELAVAMGNKQLINQVCQYGCGAILKHPVQLTEHYQDYCPNTPVCCPLDCGFQGLRKELGQHYQSCLQFPVNCPRACGKTVSRAEFQTGVHDKACNKAIIQCQYCDHSGERAAVKIHQRACHETPWQCHFCGEALRRLDQETHRESCPETRPFQLAGHTYALQPGTNALVYQRTNEPLCSHVCIPSTNTLLLNWLQGHPLSLEFSMRVHSDKYFQFRLAGHNYHCRFSRFDEDNTDPDAVAGLEFNGFDSEDETEAVNVCILDGQGKKLWLKDDAFEGIEFECKFEDDCIPRDSRREAISELEQRPTNSTAYLMISLSPYCVLFSELASTQKRVPQDQTSSHKKKKKHL